MRDQQNESNERDEWEWHLIPEQGIYVMQTGVKRMMRQFIDAGKIRMDYYEFGHLTSVTICLYSLNQFWTVDPVNGEARKLRGVAALLKSERASIDPDEVDDEPIVTWLATGETTLGRMVCKTFRRQLRGVEAPCVRYVSLDTGFLVQEEKLSTNGSVKEVTKWTIEFLGSPPAEVFSIGQIQRELRDQAQKRQAKKQKRGSDDPEGPATD